MLDAGVVVPGWQRTHFEFKVYPAGAGAGLPACRFFGTPLLGPNSHFFTIDAAECAKVGANPLWTFEGIAFAADPPLAGDCPRERIPVLRLYNNGMGGEASHRYTTSRSEARALQAAGWIVEGPVFCATP
jgi:serine protease